LQRWCNVLVGRRQPKEQWKDAEQGQAEKPRSEEKVTTPVRSHSKKAGSRPPSILQSQAPVKAIPSKLKDIFLEKTAPVESAQNRRDVHRYARRNAGGQTVGKVFRGETRTNLIPWTTVIEHHGEPTRPTKHHEETSCATLAMS